MSVSVIIGLAIIVGGCVFVACCPKKTMASIDATQGPHRDAYESDREF
jgi:hypothetical protein